MASYTSSTGEHDDEGASSSDDSVLSFWSSDDDSDVESNTTYDTLPKSGAGEKGREKGRVRPDVPSREAKEAERKRREEERGKILDAAGLKLRREAPPPPQALESKDGGSGVVGGGIGRKGTRKRRAAPGVPISKSRRNAPSIPTTSDQSFSQQEAGPGDVGTTGQLGEERDGGVGGEGIDTLDAYARYERFLQDSKSRPQATARPIPAPIAPPPTSAPIGSAPGSANNSGDVPARRFSIAEGKTTPLSPSPSTGSAGGSGRLSGLFSRIMAPSSSGGPGGSTIKVGPVISGPISRVDDSASGTPRTGSPGLTTPGGDLALTSGMNGQSAAGDVGKTWSSLVDKDVLGSISDKERKRQEVSLTSFHP